jgi:branched-chain amino acid transport system substrate-binding protein
MEVIPLVEAARIPLISFALARSITEPVKAWIFKTAPTDRHAVTALLQHLKSIHATKVGVIAEESSFGSSAQQQILEQASLFGLTIVRSESVAPSSGDVTPQLKRIRDARPDAVIAWASLNVATRVTKDFQQLHFDVPLYQGPSVANSKHLELTGPSAEGVRYVTPKMLVTSELPDTDPQKPALVRYVELAKGSELTLEGAFGPYAYDALQILAKALPGSEGDRGRIRETLEGIRGHAGVTGMFNFSPQDHNGLSADCFAITEVRKGSWTLFRR